ncbi:MAG TPA: hypothetical protein VFA82_07810 [Gaiellaceae bacterium]|nr:hypothetical protein [Gaiellaceae bacterium]
MRPRATIPATALAVAAVAAALWAGAGAGGVARSATAACRVTQHASLKGTTKTAVTFVNRTKGAVQLYWLDYKGHLVYYATIAPGAKLKQATWLTHPWLVFDSGFTCVGYVVAPRATYTVGP